LLVWWKLQVSWCYCFEYIRFSPYLVFLHFTRWSSYHLETNCCQTLLSLTLLRNDLPSLQRTELNFYDSKNDNVFIANFLLNEKVKEFLKSANIWQRYEWIISLVFSDYIIVENKVTFFFWTHVELVCVLSFLLAGCYDLEWENGQWSSPW